MKSEPQEMRPVPEVTATPGTQSNSSALLASGGEHSSEVCDQDYTIALKYLELARAEILERLKLSNQFLIVYLGGISALLGWFFAARDPARDGIVPQHVLPAVAAGLSFLAFSLSWILSENENMIERLATYQKEQLSKSLHRCSSSPMWEESSLLKKESPSTGAMVAHILVINAPNIALTVAAILLPSAQLSVHLRMTFIALAISLSCFSCGTSISMIGRRTKHRRSSPGLT